MSEVTVSPRFQVVIPRDAREEIHIEPGQKLSVIVKGGIIHFVPVVPLHKLRGFAKGMNTEGLREEVDER
jgi:AbrB family looped-hinge helix DNA binding protein